VGVDSNFSSKDVGESFPFEVIRERFLFAIEGRKMKASALDLAPNHFYTEMYYLIELPELAPLILLVFELRSRSV